MRRSGAMLVGLVVLCSAGCGPGAGNSREASGQPGSAGTMGRLSGIAVVDLDEVAKQIGSDTVLVKALRDEQASVNQQLRSYQSTLQQNYLKKKRELESEPAGNEPPEARRQLLAELERQFNLQLNQAARSAQTELKTREQKLVQQFREEVKPVARAAAAERGLGVVVTKNESVLLDFDDAHDITAAVAAKLRARQPGASSQPAASVAGRPDAAGALR